MTFKTLVEEKREEERKLRVKTLRPLHKSPISI